MRIKKDVRKTLEKMNDKELWSCLTAILRCSLQDEKSFVHTQYGKRKARKIAKKRRFFFDE